MAISILLTRAGEDERGSTIEECKLWWRIRAHGRKYDKVIAGLPNAGKQDAEKRIFHEYANLMEDLDEQRTLLYQTKVLKTAHRLFVETPPYDEDCNDWKHCRNGRDYLLTSQGLAKVRDAIRRERTARRDHIVGWIAPFSHIIISIISAIAGFYLGKLR